MTSYPDDQGQGAGAIPVWLAAKAGGGASFKNITTSTSTQVKTGAGTFLGLSVNTPESGASVTIYDGTDNTGPKIGAYAASVQGGPVIPPSGIAFATGLYVVTAGGSPADVTVSYI